MPNVRRCPALPEGFVPFARGGRDPDPYLHEFKARPLPDGDHLEINGGADTASAGGTRMHQHVVDQIGGSVTHREVLIGVGSE
jgi:hypothetical protein